MILSLKNEPIFSTKFSKGPDGDETVVILRQDSKHEEGVPQDLFYNLSMIRHDGFDPGSKITNNRNLEIMFELGANSDSDAVPLDKPVDYFECCSKVGLKWRFYKNAYKITKI